MNLRLVDQTVVLRLRAAIACLCGRGWQEPVLFSGTIRDNILYGLDRSGLSPAHLCSACPHCLIDLTKKHIAIEIAQSCK